MSHKMRLALAVVLTIIAVLLVNHFAYNDKIVGAPTVNYGALHLERVSYPMCGDTSYDRYCTHHGSGWNSYGVGNASADGKIGPHYVRVPDVVRKNFRAAVFRRGSDFTARVRKNFAQFDHKVWRVACAMEMGTWAVRKVTDPDYRMLPKCLTAKQMLNTLGTKVWKPALKCGGDALIGTGIGSVVAKSGKGGVIGALVGTATCGAQGAWNYYVDTGQAQEDGKWLWHGFKSLTVAEAKALHYMF